MKIFYLTDRSNSYFCWSWFSFCWRNCLGL